MQVVCIDSKGHRICELEYSITSNTLESKNWVQITRLQDIRPAQDADFTKLPILHQGFLDSHMHPSWMAKLLSQIDLTQKPILQIKDEILSSTKETIYGFGWNEEFHNIPLEEASKFFDSYLPQNKELYLFRKCGHSAYLSHTAKKKLNIAHSELIKDDELYKIPSLKITSLEFTENFQKVLLKLKQEGISACCDLLLSDEDIQRLSNFEDTDFDLQYFGDIHDLERFQGLSRKRTPYVKFFLDGRPIGKVFGKCVVGFEVGNADGFLWAVAAGLESEVFKPPSVRCSERHWLIRPTDSVAMHGAMQIHAGDSVAMRLENSFNRGLFVDTGGALVVDHEIKALGVVWVAIDW